MLLSQTPSDTPQPPSQRRQSLSANMTSLFTKAKGKVGGKSKSPKTSPERSIPPEPVQQAPHGDFSEKDAGPAMQVHNLARANKQCPRLDWSTDLAKEAQEYAQKLAEKEQMEHSGVQGQGENLFMSSGDAEFDQAVQSWMEEEKDYNGEKVGEGEFQKWGHYCEFLDHVRNVYVLSMCN